MTRTPLIGPQAGERIGPYRLDAPIGSGGMGTVWRAWDERLRRHVAVWGTPRGWRSSPAMPGAVRLSAGSSERARACPRLSSLWAYHLVRGDRQPTIDLADEIARLAESPAQLYMGYFYASARLATGYWCSYLIEACLVAGRRQRV